MKTLLLNNNYEVLAFINVKRAFKLLLNGKAESIIDWSDSEYEREYLKHPAILRLKSYIKRNFISSVFNRRSLVKRDKSRCQYCNIKLLPAQITIDHIFPKSQGGIISYTNCVVACQICNNKKANRTPEQAGMALLKAPIHPAFVGIFFHIYEPEDHWHKDWDNYIRL